MKPLAPVTSAFMRGFLERVCLFDFCGMFKYIKILSCNHQSTTFQHFSRTIDEVTRAC